MALDFVTLPHDTRKRAFEQAALRMELNPVIVEKDFWVCFMLRLLFQGAEFCGQFVFKGGTSLSKVFGVIERFSEDIDISVSPAFLGFSEQDLENIATKSQRDKQLKQLEKKCTEVVREQVQPALEAAVSKQLGDVERPWLELVQDERTNCPVLMFGYPSCTDEGFAYLRRFVKLEFGSLTDQQPRGEHPVSPWVADVFPQLFTGWRCEVIALEIERSFWEKATILHAEHHRPAEKPMPGRFSRHYSDLAALARSSYAEAALARTDLRDRVSDWKRRFFASSWASYETAKPGSFKLLPPDSRLAELHADYESMRDMFMKRPVPFETVLQQLTELEDRLNSLD